MDEESLFAAALRKANAADRQAFLEAACAGDIALRRRVERLITAHLQTIGILDQSAQPPEWTEFTGDFPRNGPPAGECVGSVVGGRYELLEKIGEGGMGTVWLAEQTQPVRRKVALKLIKPGMDSRSVLARFEAERQALALMEHPNIARVLDGGTTENGRPFFAMEYVKGVPLTEYCDEALLSIEARLELFVIVCQAVQHAHAKGVIHRDLKPSNILVCMHDGRPVPKVIDFGVAKAIQQPLTEQTLLTAPGALLGTPLYMSPEQAGFHHPDVDTRADIYALGVILYELLTGTTPLERPRFREVGWHEMFRLIKEEEPPRPSERLGDCDALPSVAALRQLEPVRLTRVVRGELDWIVMKCLEKDRARRYETANGLARDVQRYLIDESVEACPPSVGYRFGKFLRRNRGTMIAASTIFLLLVGGIVGTTWGLIRADRARKDEANRAEGERIANARSQERVQQIEKLTEILASVFEDIDSRSEEREDKPLSAILGDRLAQAAERVESLEVTEPLQVARLQDKLGNALVHLGMAEQATSLFERSRELRTCNLGPEDPETLESMNRLANCYLEAGDYGRAQSLYEETLRVRRSVLGAKHPRTLASMDKLAVAYHKAGYLKRAIPMFEETFELQKALLGSDHNDTVNTMEDMAIAYKADGKPLRALPLQEEVVRLRRVKHGPEHFDTLESMGWLAMTYKEVRRFDLALPLMEDILRISRAKLGPTHILTLTSLNNLAVAYRVNNQYKLAQPLFEESFELRKARYGPDNIETINAMQNLGEFYSYMEQLDRALPLLEDALKWRKANLDRGHPDTIVGANNLAEAYRRANRLDDALPLMEETLGLVRDKFDRDHPATITFVYNLATAYADAGDPGRALPLAREVATTIEAARFEHPRAGQVIDTLGEIHERLGQFDEAESWRRKWLEAAEAQAGTESRLYTAALEALGTSKLVQKRWECAEGLLRASLAQRLKHEPDFWGTFSNQSRLGEALLELHAFDEAESLLIPAYEGLKSREEKIPTRELVRLSEARERIVRLYEAWGKPEKAAEWRDPNPKRQAADRPAS